MRLRNNPNALTKLKQTNYLLTSLPYKVNKKTIIELGMGKGEMITQLAKNNLDFLFIGIEKYPTVAYKASKLADKLNLNNFKIICSDIINLHNLLIGKVNTIWLTFPDPWSKNRYEKRRLTHKRFLDLYKNLLNKNGVLKFKTDNNKLFNYSIESLKQNNFKLKNITKNLHTHKIFQKNILTGYEKKWIKVQKNINYLEARLS